MVFLRWEMSEGIETAKFYFTSAKEYLTVDELILTDTRRW